jgi:MFS family permease
MVLSISLLGDSLLYLILPVAAIQFGISPLWIGILLSVNRFIRLGVNYALVPLVSRIGLHGLAIMGAILATISTLAYGILIGGVALLIARVTWGIAFAALRLTTLSYATADPETAGKELGVSTSIIAIAPFLVLTVGAAATQWIGERHIFIVLGVLTTLSILLALKLPNDIPARENMAVIRKPKHEDWIVFIATFGADGVFVVSISALLLAEGYGTATAIQIGGAILAGRRLSNIVLAPISGRLADRWGMGRLFGVALLFLTAGFGLMGMGVGIVGAILTLIGGSATMTLAPGIAAEGAGEDRVLALASVSTWRDLGAAFGALFAGSLLSEFGVYPLFLGIGGIILVAVVHFGVYHQSPYRMPD